MTTPTKPRVVIDCMKSGGFFVYSDEGVEVVLRSAHLPGEELIRAGRHPIPEAWLSDKAIGSEDEQFAELVAEMGKLVVSTIKAARKSSSDAPAREMAPGPRRLI